MTNLFRLRLSSLRVCLRPCLRHELRPNVAQTEGSLRVEDSRSPQDLVILLEQVHDGKKVEVRGIERCSGLMEPQTETCKTEGCPLSASGYCPQRGLMSPRPCQGFLAENKEKR